MRRHGTDHNLESPSPERFHHRKLELVLPTTLSSTLALQSSTRRRKSTPKKKQSTGPLFVQKNGVVTFRPSLIKGFVFVGVAALLGVHLFLFRQLAAPSNTNQLVNTTFSSNNRVLTPLQPRDREQYTIRINTWRRLDQLMVSIDHHASCPGVAQIQVVWCEPQDPPAALLQLHPDKVVIERHTINSLNERFRVTTPNTPTLGILSMDDDVLRPCQAIDSGFFQWTRSPERMVGFDYRMHVKNDDGSWKYGYLSTTQKANRYSMSLPRYAFLHRDYLDWYMQDLPQPIFDHVAEHFECEDIAMSFFVSSHTDGEPPLLAHFWAIETMVKLWSASKISGTKNHKSLRDQCVEQFAQALDLKDRLFTASVLHRNDTLFYCGDEHRNNNINPPLPVGVPQRQQDHFQLVDQWRQLSGKEASRKIADLKKEASLKAQAAGLIENSNEWKQKYQKDK